VERQQAKEKEKAGCAWGKEDGPSQLGQAARRGRKGENGPGPHLNIQTFSNFTSLV
jgi:hypothetical protein